MSDVAFLDFEDFEYEPYSPAGHGASETSDKKIFILKIFSFSIIVVLSLYFILANLIFPCFEVPQITFTGASAGTVEKMKGLLNAPSEYNYFNFDTARVARALNSLSCIESVEVIKHFPHIASAEVWSTSGVSTTKSCKEILTSFRNAFLEKYPNLNNVQTLLDNAPTCKGCTYGNKI